VCFTNDGAVFLDIRHNEYFGLDRAQSEQVRRLIDGHATGHDAEPLACELLRRGLVTRTLGCPRPFRRAEIDTPTEFLADGLLDKPNRIRVLHVLRFVTACFAVGVALRLRSLEYAIVRARRRKVKLAKSGRSRGVEEARELVAIFTYLRPIFYVALDHCLYDSLVLSDFLQRHAVQCTCVFGVKTLPFVAHCWVQIGPHVANSNPQVVATYSPILAV
jgi:hypothetical protein